MKIGATTTCLVLFISTATFAGDKPRPKQVTRWFAPQNWIRDTDGPVISLGKAGAFDDTHLFAPCVIQEKDRFQLWYCGSRKDVANRVFSLGLAISDDGRSFTKSEKNPVYNFGDGKHSILTATMLRNPNGSVLREEGKLRMWFSSTHFAGGTGKHTLHEATSIDGIDWSQPSAAQLEGLYAPTILREQDRYRMWYSDVSKEPWVVSYAESSDGKDWKVIQRGVVKIDQKWESGRLFYPAVIKADGVYLMWYGSYWSAQKSKTALGLAVSQDGIHWHKHPANPVFRPDPDRPWESHYTTSQSIIRFKDGSFRIWYASRRKPPFVNKYFAIGTARWSGPTERPATGINQPD